MRCIRIRGPAPSCYLGFYMLLRILALAIVPALSALAAPCGTLATLSLPRTTVTAAESAGEGRSTVCRVAATLKPSTDSDIKIEVWMPESGWNGKYQAVGN